MLLHLRVNRPLRPQAASWLRIGLRLLGLISWVVVLLFFGYLALGVETAEPQQGILQVGSIRLWP